MAVFAGLPRAYGIYVIGDEDAKPGKKRKGKADTLQHDVTEELWERHLRGEIQLGIVPIRDDATCVFGAIDIDVYPLDHAALLAKIRKLKLPLTMIRSKSGGAHLMVFLATPMPAVEVRERLSDWAAALGASVVAQNPLLMGVVVARPLVRNALLSGPVQKTLATPRYGPNALSKRAVEAAESRVTRNALTRASAAYGTQE